MKREFKIGDKVALYVHSGREVGRITEILHNDRVRLSVIGLYTTYIAHVKQLRHLVTKKRREIFLLEYSNEGLGGAAFPSIESATVTLSRSTVGGKVVRFVEAKEKRSKK